jgi:hypothetical protein
VQEQDEGMAADLCGFVKNGLPHLTESLHQREKSYPQTEQNENVPVDMV